MNNNQRRGKKTVNRKIVIENRVIVTIITALSSATVAFWLVSQFGRYLPSEGPHPVYSANPAGIGRI